MAEGQVTEGDKDNMMRSALLPPCGLRRLLPTPK